MTTAQRQELIDLIKKMTPEQVEKFFAHPTIIQFMNENRDRTKKDRP